MLKGYKSFNKDLSNKNGVRFEVGETYIEDCDLSFNVDERGFMFCERPEDTIFFAPDRENVTIAEVTALGEIVEGESGQGTYENIYTTNKMRIDRVLPRKEIIDMFLNMNERNIDRVIRFIQMYNLTPEEIAMFYERYVTSVAPTIKVMKEDGTVEYDYVHARERVQQALDYYQEKEKGAYQKTKLNQQ